MQLLKFDFSHSLKPFCEQLFDIFAFCVFEYRVFVFPGYLLFVFALGKTRREKTEPRGKRKNGSVG